MRLVETMTTISRPQLLLFNILTKKMFFRGNYILEKIPNNFFIPYINSSTVNSYLGKICKK